MLNDQQQRKALVLSLLMVMLAQTAYIESYRGWTLGEAASPSHLNAACNSISRPSSTPIYVDASQGSDDWNGTWSCPKATLAEALNDASADDEIVLATGRYHENVTVNNKDNLLIRAADGARVVFDGTLSIADDLNASWGIADGNGIQETTLPVDGWQLFLSYDEQVPARWPNAQFSDATVFNRSYWAEGTLTGSNSAYTQGWLTDAGPEAGVHTGLNETVNATGLDPVGAIAVLNLGSFRSNSRIITDWNASNGTFAYDGNGVGWKNKHHAYFLEGKRELIDQDGEWWFNNTNNRLYYKTPSGQDANGLDLRVKVQPFAISVENSDGVTIQGIDFFGTTVNFNNCDGCSFTNATLEYPSTSKRGLGIAGESENDRWMTRFYRSTNSFVDNISITNTDGGAIEFQGSAGQSHNNTVNNSYFHAIDWSAADQKGLMTTVYEGGRDMYFTNNTVHLTGASSVLSIGDAPKVFYNEVWDVGHLQTDGAVVQIMQGEAPGAEVAYNWIHDIIKYGIRFDAPIGQIGQGRNGTMHHNVIWNAAGGLMVKGDYHDIHNNTVFNSSASKNDIIALTDGGINNKNSTFHRNAVDSMADHRSDDVHDNPLPNGTHWSNWNGYLQGYDDMYEPRNQLSCAIYDNGSLYCWGRNDHGQLGLGYTSGREEAPQYVDLGTGRTITSLGIDDSGAEGWAPNSHSCAVLDNGELLCWGANDDGQLGLGNTTSGGVWEPTTVNVGSGLTTLSVAVGNGATCALLSDHSVKCWGKNNNGQLGLGNTSNNDVLTPHTVTFTGSSTPISLHAGRIEFCARLDNGSAACWGGNDFGQFGLGNSTAQNTPIPLSIPTGRTITSMSVSKEFMCLSLDNGSVVCAGKNNVYQLGTGATSTQETTWQYVADLDTGVHSVELAAQTGCAHLVNGSMVCWGKDEWGLFGNDVASAYGSPRIGQTASEYVNFGAGRTAASIGLNFRHACAVLDNGDLTCWGRNHRAQLGLGNTTQQYQPVVVSNVSSLRQLAVHEMLVDPANDDFRPKWGSPLQQLSAGAYDAGDADPWTAGVSWTYSPMSDPVSACMNSLAINYNSDAVFSDGSCIYTTLSSSSSTLSLEVGVSMTPYTLTYSTPFLADDTQTAAASGAVGLGTNIAHDSNGAVHICSKTVASDDLYYTTNASGSWQSATIDSTGNIGGDCFIILDSDDDIHITYRDDSNTNLKYATKALSSAIASSNWAVSTMDNNGNVGNFGSMAVDANDTLHVAYYSANGASLKYATLADGSTTWSREVVESTNDVGKYTSIALDSNGNPHITYYDDTNNDLRYTHKMGSSWTFTTLDSTAHTGKGTSLAIDSNDHLHVAYKTNSTEIAYMTNRSGSWVKTTLDVNSTGNWGVNYINIMLDEGDDPHVVYSDMVDYDIFYMSNTRGTWERIHVAGDSISKSSEAAMDENGGIHVAYHIDGAFDDVGYAAVRSLAHRPVFEISPDLPQGLSLGAENGTVFGTPMEYFDLTEFTVWANTTRTSAYATFSMNVDWELQASVDWMKAPRNTAITPITFNWTAWSSSVVNSTTAVANTGDNGNYNGIVVDSNDNVHIVYYREDNANLMYSTNASGSWQTTTVESSNNVGKYCNLAIDGNDGLHISYQYNSGNALKYAYKSASSSSWTKTTVDNTGGKYTSIATDSNNNPHIAYRDSGGDVGYATKSSGASWTYGTVQSAGDIAFTSIAVDADDHVHIAYYDANNKDMYHLTNTSGSWARTFLEDIGTNTGGTALDIAIDPTTDEPGISYFDMDATSLKYTYYTGSAWSATTVENSADYGRFNSIVYDSVGNVHISHERNSADDLYYTSDKTGTWVSTAVDTTNSVGTHTSIAVDSNDDLHIAYRHNSFSRTMHATVQGYKISSADRANVSGATCSISPSLPFGLSLNQGTCTISGTPTSHGFNTTYNVTATSSTDVSKSGEFKLWVTQIAPSIAYTGSPFTFTVGTAISSITPTNTGDSAFWSVSPSLPSGLSLGAGGVISGTPSVEASTANYTITASNPGGESSATVSITVNAQPPSGLSYATENMTLTKGTAMTTNTPSVSGGAATSWEISPSLPTGLSLSSSTGEISGTPTVLQTTSVTYTVWANNSGGSTSANINITINDAAPLLSYSTTEIIGTKGVAISPNIGPTTSGGAITSWEISPSPGSAFHFNTGNGFISGTPSVLLTRTQYTIWGNNSGGTSVAYVNVTINDAVPNALGYTIENMTLEKGTAMTTNPPSVSGGAVTSWEISPSVPTGLSFGSTNGSLWGTPTVLQTTAVTYTIWANNSGGSESAQVNITINDQIASISYSTPVNISNNRPLASTITPVTSGGAITSWEISPSLPAGLTFGTTNGSIWGTPENVTSNATYTIYANNSGGSASGTLTLNINWTLTPIVDGLFITRNASMSTNITWEWDYDPLEGDSLSIVTGEFNTCAIKSNGDVYCWGRNGNGQIGNGQISQANTACGVQGHKCKDVPTLSGIKGTNGYDAVSLAFGDRHACALLDDGAVMCWGRNNAGQLGVSGGDRDTPQSVNLGTGRTAKSIHAGGHFSCAILDDDSVKCWGQNDQGQLGIGTSSNTNTPTTVASFGTGRTAVALALAFKTACALLDDGSVKCWGDRANGLLGNGGSTTDLDAPPASAINLGSGRTAKAVTGGKAHFCVILDDDSIKCWGEGANGKLGTGSTGGQNTPTSTSGSFGSGRYAVAIDAGYQHTCVILDNGALTCWGGDGKGQLGNGAVSGTLSSLQSSTVNLGAGRTAISLSAGGEHTCAQLDNDELMCWGNRGDGQVGDNGGFNSPSDRTSPVSVNGNHTYLDTGVFPSSLVADATCGISPALPTGLSLISGTCIITGTPTATAVNTTYTVWANISGLSFSGQVWLEVGLNLPIVSYSPATYTYTKGSAVSTIVPSNTGGEVVTWAINGTLPSGLFFGTSNGSIWGTPDAVTPSTTYTVWANNSAGSASTTITFTTNDVAPSITFSPSSLTLAVGTPMTSISVSNTGGTIVSCNVSPSLPSGLSLSNTCVLSGTPTVVSGPASYTITATNTGGSDTATFSLTVQASGGTLTITPANREGSGNSPLANINMSYTHTASNYGWTSGVSNTTTSLASNFDYGGGVHWLGADSGEQGELVVVYARNDLTTSTHSLALLYRWNGVWTETILDNGTNTGHHPSVVIDRQGAIHIAYIDDDNDKLRYATNASGSWVLTTLGNSSIDSDGGRGTAIVVHPITDAVHIVATNYEDSARTLQYHTNEGGSWFNETITDTTKDEGHDPAMAMDSDGNLHVAYQCDDGCEDLRLSSRIDGVWQNETVSSSGDIGYDPDIAIDSQDTIHIVSKYAGSNGRVYLHSGTPGSWTENTGLGGAYAYWPVVGVDSNDAVHISYHRSWTYKDVMYMTNASGAWSTASIIDDYGGWGSEMVIDANDDILIPNIHPGSNGVSRDDELQLTTVTGSGQGLTARPTYDISPMLPPGLTMNWRTGTVSGTPTQALDNTTFTVTVTSLGATTTGTFTLFITGAPGLIAYNDIQASNQTAITPVMVSLSNNNTSGAVTSWAISPNLPAGLSFGSTNGSIWGTPTVERAKTTYTVWANNTAGPSSTSFNITIAPQRPGPFEYNPADNIWTNNTEVHLAPQFFDQITGNGSTWQAADIRSGPGGSQPGQRMSILVGDTVYFDAYDPATGTELYAYNTSNHSVWRVTDIQSGSGGSYPGGYSSILAGDTLYFSAVDGSTGHELWAHNTSNGTTWQVANIRSGSSNSNPGSNMMHVVDGVLYFNAHDGNKGMELWKHDPSTVTTSRVYDINAGSTGSSTGKWMNMVVGDVLYFSANDGSTGSELWAYNTSNSSNPWRVADIYSGASGSEPGMHMNVLVGSTIYFDAAATGGRELWAHNISNLSTWRVVDIYTGSMGSDPGDRMALLVGDTIYFDANDGSTGDELWAHDTSNHSTWRVTDIVSGSSSSAPGHYMSILVGDTVYFSAFTGSSGHELWAHDTSNHSTWQVAEINTYITMGGGGLGSYPGQYMAVPLGDTIYFSASVEQQGTELWAHDTSNRSTWRVADIYSGSTGSSPGSLMEVFVGDTLYFSADDGIDGVELWAHRPSTIDFITNTGGAVTSWAISPSLPSGVSFFTNNGTIYGTPTELWTKTSYTVWANNSGGSRVAYLNITVVDDVPTLSYSPTSLNLTNNTVSSDLPLAPTLTGTGEITSWAVNASLPAGLNFGTSNGTVWGVPSELQLSPVNYTIWANNSGGSTSATITITVVDQVPTVAYAPASLNLINNTAGGDLPLEPTLTGPGEFTSWAINASLPTGLSFGANNGTFYGTPTELWTTTAYTVWANNSGGSTEAYLNITVVDQIPTITYVPSDLTLTNNTVSPDLPLHATLTGPGDILSWALNNTSLPSGISFGTSNGTLYGTPTELWPTTAYMVWANNSGGSSVAYLNLTVVDQLPALSYSLTALNLTNNTVSADLPLTATLTGPGEILSWAINGTLPSGLNFGTSNGTVWGTPTQLWPTTAYTVYANNSGGAAMSYLNITVVDQVPVLSYSPTTLSLTNNTAHADLPLVPTLTGTGEITSWAVNASLPAGLNFGTSNGTVWGVPTELQISPANYTIWGNNSGGSTSATITITVVDQVPAVAYVPSSLNLTNNTAGGDLPFAPTLTGPGEITSWAINASLPSGLSFGANNGTFYGTPTELWTTTAYMVWANNSGGSTEAYLNITVVDQLPALTYTPSDLMLTNNTASVDLPLNATLTGPGEILSWVINASLPSGLTFETSNGTVWGTPTELWPQTAYMVWANNSGGSAVAYLNITVVDQLPTLAYVPANLTLYNDTASGDLPLNATLTGPGEITSWAIQPDVPSGLTFETSNGTIWGVPTQRLSTTMFTVWANNSGGSSEAYINITVLHREPIFTYASYNLTLVNNTAMTPLTATLTGGEITSWEIDPSAPTGLSLGSVNGTVWGTPTVVQNTTMYTVWANNSGGSHAVFVNLTVYDPAVSLDYNPENLTLTRNESAVDLHPVYTGIVDNWTIVPALPAGLTFTDGVIAGTPTVNMTLTLFTVWANNSGGSSSHSINITVLEPVPTLDYNPENMTLVRGTQMTDMVPTLGGGMVELWTIYPALPAGLLFDNGTVSGTATVNMTTTMFMVWANNTGGSVSHTINLTVLEPSGDLSYNPENLTLTRGVAMVALSPTYTGGAVENWSIHPALPAGLIFTNGVLSGTPTVNMSLIMFTVWANNSGGVASATINITVLEPVVDLLYSPDNLTLVRGTTMTVLSPSVSGGSVETWDLVGALPTGLSFSNGVFSGTPLVNMTRTPYLVYANTTGGSATAWVNITVLEPPVNLSYNPHNLTLIRNETMDTLFPTVTGGNVGNWSITPALPSGLNFADGVISGTPQVNMTSTMFTVWANTTGGSSTASVNITVLEPAVNFSYDLNSIVLTRNETMSVSSPMFGTDGKAEEWGILPALPQGLNFTNGTISGTPEVNMTATVFTVYANNSGGTVLAYLTITILEPLATVVYLPENVMLTRGEDNASILPILGGGQVAAWSINPQLPDGMVFDNGSIRGVPTVNSTKTIYTVSATNTGGLAYAYLNITVVEPLAVLALNESFLLTRGEDLLNVSVNNTGGMVASWWIEPALPPGLTMNHGALFGVAEVNLTATTFTIYANNSGGSSTVSFMLEVIEPVAIIGYLDAEVTLVSGVTPTKIVPLLAGGTPQNWSIEPALPPGLAFVDGYIVGVAETNLSTTTFTVYANNTGGVAIATFNLTVNQPTFYARYLVTRYVLDVNETMDSKPPLYYFGNNQNPVWSISPSLPEGLVFDTNNGRINGAALEPSNETNYSVVVYGEMAPVQLFVIIEVREVAKPIVVESVRNTTEVVEYQLPVIEEVDDSFDMYWICFPILLVITLLLAAAINNFLALTSKPQNDEEDNEGDEESEDG